MSFFRIVDKIVEATFSDLKRKQRSVTKLFPTFYKRVAAVAEKGGVRFIEMDKTGWLFAVHSGTKDDVWYDFDLQFKDAEKALQDSTRFADVWKKNKKEFDYRKLAKQFFKFADIRVNCSCPAQQYWGPAFILSQPKYDAKVPPPENRPPDIRNPNKYSAVCKHGQAIFNVLPFYYSSLAKWLKNYYPDLVKKYENIRKKYTGKLSKKVGENVNEESPPPIPDEELDVEEPKEEKPEKKEIEIEEPVSVRYLRKGYKKTLD